MGKLLTSAWNLISPVIFTGYRCSALLHFPPFAIGSLMLPHPPHPFPPHPPFPAHRLLPPFGPHGHPLGPLGLETFSGACSGIPFPCGKLPIAVSDAFSVGTTSCAVSLAVRILPPLWNWSGRGFHMRSPNVKHTAIKVVPVLHSNFLFISTNVHIQHHNTLTVFRAID